MRHLLNRLACLLICLGGLSCGHDAVAVATVPADQAAQAIRALGKAQIAAKSRRVGAEAVIEVRAAAESSARSVILAVGGASAQPPRPGLVLGPTAARLDAEDHRRRHLESAISALHPVLAARLTRVDRRWHAVITTLSDPGETDRKVRALLGADARVLIEPLQIAPATAQPIAPATSSRVLSVTIAVLILTIVGLLTQVRRLRRNLGR